MCADAAELPRFKPIHRRIIVYGLTYKNQHLIEISETKITFHLFRLYL